MCDEKKAGKFYFLIALKIDLSVSDFSHLMFVDYLLSKQANKI
ncbi:MAG: hypothetical protein ACJAWV_002390 [Flammeovirgaceae bacterium]|jgi:hypothetical protein